MQTIHIEVADDKLELFLTIINNLKKDIIQNIKLADNQNILDIEPIEKDSQDYKDIEAIKAENNIKYSLDEAKDKLGI
jgi:hypothetical protein